MLVAQNDGVTVDGGASGHTFDVVRWDRSGFARREFLSSDTVDWPSVLLEEVASEPDVDEAHIPASSDCQVVLVLGGNAIIESFGDRGWRRAAYVPGQISMTRPGRPARVRWRSVQGQAPRTLHAVIPNVTMSSALEQMTDGQADPEAMPDCLAVSDPVISATLLALRRAAHAKADPLYAEAAAWHLAVHLLAEHRQGPPADISPVSESRLARVQEFVQENLDWPITLAEMAAVAGLSQFHFGRKFRAATGRTPHQYVLEIRLARARDLLRSSSAPISQIAQRCGFTSPSHFAAAFKRCFGVSPTNYRSQSGRSKN